MGRSEGLSGVVDILGRGLCFGVDVGYVGVFVFEISLIRGFARRHISVIKCYYNS
jgi:hypothetical protein